MSDDFIWRPSAGRVEHANVTRLGRALGAGGYHELHRISIEEPDRFWPALIDDLGIEFSRRWDAVVDSSRGPEWSTWFVGGQVNIAPLRSGQAALDCCQLGRTYDRVQFQLGGGERAADRISASDVAGIH